MRVCWGWDLPDGCKMPLSTSAGQWTGPLLRPLHLQAARLHTEQWDVLERELERGDLRRAEALRGEVWTLWGWGLHFQARGDQEERAQGCG